MLLSHYYMITVARLKLHFNPYAAWKECTKSKERRVDKNARGSLYRFWGREFPKLGRFVAEFQPS